MALLFQYLPFLIMVALGVYTYKWASKHYTLLTVLPRATEGPDYVAILAARRALITGLVVRILITVGAFMIATSINTNYGPRFKAEPTPIVHSVTTDKNGAAPVIRDVERKPRFNAEQSESRTREMLDWKAAHAQRDHDLAKQKELLKAE